MEGQRHLQLGEVLKAGTNIMSCDFRLLSVTINMWITAQILKFQWCAPFLLWKQSWCSLNKPPNPLPSPKQLDLQQNQGRTLQSRSCSGQIYQAAVVRMSLKLQMKSLVIVTIQLKCFKCIDCLVFHLSNNRNWTCHTESRGSRDKNRRSMIWKRLTSWLKSCWLLEKHNLLQGDMVCRYSGLGWSNVIFSWRWRMGDQHKRLVNMQLRSRGLHQGGVVTRYAVEQRCG